MIKKIYIASDHAGFTLKTDILQLSKENIFDLGAYSSSSVDYPDYAYSLVNKIILNTHSLGILICGSGVGMSIAANRDPRIRAGLAFNSKIAKLMRQHNDANILILPGRFINIQEALNCVDNFLSTNFEAGRHQVRVNKLNKKI